MTQRWSSDLDQELTTLVEDVVRGNEQAWHRLLVEIGPRVETWARQSRLLRRLGIDTEDDARAVLVSVLARLRANGFANLRRYLESAGCLDATDNAELAEARVLERVARGAELCRGAEDTPQLAVDEQATPLRAWLLALVRYAAKDHVKQRFGWRSSAKAVLDLAPAADDQIRRAVVNHLATCAGVCGVVAAENGEELAVEYLPGAQSPAALVRELASIGVEAQPRAASGKRDVNTNAERLANAPDHGERPPVTDWFALTRFLEEVCDHMATFPEPMRMALELWLQDFDFADIGMKLGLREKDRSPADQARALLRAAQARLRDRFRDRWPLAAHEIPS